MSGFALLAFSVWVIGNSLLHKTANEKEEADCSLGSDHTMCLYKGPAPGCTPGSLSGAERDKIIEVHNKLRAKVASGSETRSSTGDKQPSAANMLRMEYDQQIAKVAQRWAEQCIFKHDKNRKDKRFKSVGQNIAYRANSDPSFQFPLEQLITDWYDEVDMFDPSIVKKYRFDSATGHYTQVVWHDTYAIGCGYAWDTKNGMKHYRIVCNYAPGGNVIETEMYEIGDPCSNCPSDRKTCYSGALCG